MTAWHVQDGVMKLLPIASWHAAGLLESAMPWSIVILLAELSVEES